jgi:hypothetical protein
MLHGGAMVAVGDPQQGQSLPGWRHVVGRYENTPDGVCRLLAHLDAEVTARSLLLAQHGVDHYDPDNPVIMSLGLKPLAAVIDEIQIVLANRTPQGKQATRHASNIANLGRKTGISLILATQLPQIPSLGYCFELRDALVAGNCLVLRVSNKGSGETVLPADFPGDPFSIPAEIEIDGVMKPTAGWCYSRGSGREGMRARVLLVNEDRVFREAPRVPVEWLAPDPANARKTSGGSTAGPGDAGGAGDVDAEFTKMINMFGSGVPDRKENDPSGGAKKWVIVQLRAAPQSAKSLLSRSDCPVSKTQLYRHLKDLEGKDLICKHGDIWKVT